MKTSVATASGLFVLTIFMAISLLTAGMPSAESALPATAHAAILR